jgi:hypothetical protein
MSMRMQDRSFFVLQIRERFQTTERSCMKTAILWDCGMRFDIWVPNRDMMFNECGTIGELKTSREQQKFWDKISLSPTPPTQIQPYHVFEKPGASTSA